MGKKIKSIGGKGLIGILLMVVSVYLLVGLFRGTTNLQSYVRNRQFLADADARIGALESELARTKLHINLIQSHSPDFISELASRQLNLGSPNVFLIRN